MTALGAVATTRSSRLAWPSATPATARGTNPPIVSAVPVRSAPTCPWRRHQAASLAQLRADDRAGYRQACSWMLTMASQGHVDSPLEAARIAWTCALGPDSVTDYAPAIGLAQEAIASAPTPLRAGARAVLGAVLYRAGRYSEALDRLEKWPASGGSPPPPQVFAFLAMTHHRLGHTELARQCLERVPAQSPEDKEPSWDALEVELLRREAQALVRVRVLESER